MVMLILILVAVGLCIATWRNSRSRRNLPPGPSPIVPFLGNLLHLAKYKDIRMYHMFDKLVEEFGPVVYLQTGRLSTVIVQDLKLAKEVLNNDVFVDRFYDSLLSERSFGRPLGVLFNFGEGWKEIRRFTMKTLRDFGFGKKTSMEKVLSSEISILFETLDKSAESGDDMCMRHFFSLTVLNILWSMVAGHTFSHDDERLKGFLRLLDDLSRNNPMQPDTLELIPLFWRLNTFSAKLTERRYFFKQFQDFFKEILDERRALGNYKKDPADFFDVFLAEIDKRKGSPQNENLFTDEQFIITSFDLFAAGGDTTAKTLEFAMLYMILNPRAQKKVQEEIDRVLGKEVRPTLADKSRLPYTEATIMEVQRLANLVAVIFRGAAEDSTLAGYHIPKGTLVGVNNMSLHKSKQLWDDPEEFRPERFLDSSGSSIVNAHNILPFGLGKRVCLGESLARASLFAYFSSILQRYSFSPSPNHPLPTTEPFYGFVSSPESYYVTVSRRYERETERLMSSEKGFSNTNFKQKSIYCTK